MATLRTLGPRRFASYAVLRATAPLPNVAYLRYLLIAVPRGAMPAMPRGHHVRTLTYGEIAAAAIELSATTIDFRLGQGMSCLGAFRGDRLLGVTWLTEGGFDEDELPVRFEPPPGAAWDTGLYVRPEERGGRAFAALWAGTSAWLAERGLNWSMSRITDYNEASRRAHSRMMARSVGALTALRLGRHQWAIGASPCYFRIGDQSYKRPIVRLRTPERED